MMLQLAHLSKFMFEFRKLWKELSKSAYLCEDPACITFNSHTFSRIWESAKFFHMVRTGLVYDGRILGMDMVDRFLLLSLCF